MIRLPAIINASVAQVKIASDNTLKDYRNALIEDEVAFTNRLLTNIQTGLDGFTVKGIKWYSKVLTDHGSKAQERQHGADFVGILSIDIDGYQVTKGFLAQAKRTSESGAIHDSRRMNQQCEAMLERSPASYVLLYSKQNVRVAPAVAVVGSQHFESAGSYTRDITSFYKDHFECFAGDRRVFPDHLLSNPNTDPSTALPEELPMGKRIIQRLEELAQKTEEQATFMQRLNAPNLLALVATNQEDN